MATVARIESRTLSDVEVAKLIRVELKAAFPSVKFSVRSTSSINIRYTDGPTPKRVEAIVSKFEGKSFDGMTDSTRYTPPFLYNGEWVSTYCYVFVNRELSHAFVARIVGAVAKYYGIDTPPVVEGWVKPTLEQERECRRKNFTDWGTMIHRASQDRASVSPKATEAAFVAAVANGYRSAFS